MTAARTDQRTKAEPEWVDLTSPVGDDVDLHRQLRRDCIQAAVQLIAGDKYSDPGAEALFIARGFATFVLTGKTPGLRYDKSADTSC